MNERIKQLWEDSTKSCWPKPGKFTAGEYDYNLTEFAELIVKECAKVCADVGMQSGGGCTTVGETYLDASKRIRENFGMETWNLY